jgi:hypothetical protein
MLRGSVHRHSAEQTDMEARLISRIVVAAIAVACAACNDQPLAVRREAALAPVAGESALGGCAAAHMTLGSGLEATYADAEPAWAQTARWQGGCDAAGLVAYAAAQGIGRAPVSVDGSVAQMAPNTDYLASTAAQLVLLLPAHASPGDTVSITGAARGGWKIAQRDGQSIVVGHGAHVIGAPAWTPTALAPPARDADNPITIERDLPWPLEHDRPTADWTAIASSADGKRLIAARREIDGGDICVSADAGSTWQQTTAPIANWNSVASSADGQRLIAATDGRAGLMSMVASDDGGRTWVARTSAPARIHHLAMSADAARIYAASDLAIFVSLDAGLNWTQSYAGPDGNFVSIGVSADGQRVVAGTLDGSLYTSLDGGADWSAAGEAARWYGVDVSRDGSRLHASAATGSSFSAAFGKPASSTTGVGGFLQGNQSTAATLKYVGAGRFLLSSSTGTLFVQ